MLVLAIFKVNKHVLPEPIFNIVGLSFGINVHEPLFDHVFRPVEFVETRDDNFTTLPAVKDDTFHFTVIDGAALTTPTTATPAKTPTRSNAPIDLRDENRDLGETSTR